MPEILKPPTHDHRRPAWKGNIVASAYKNLCLAHPALEGENGRLHYF